MRRFWIVFWECATICLTALPGSILFASLFLLFWITLPVLTVEMDKKLKSVCRSICTYPHIYKIIITVHGLIPHLKYYSTRNCIFVVPFIILATLCTTLSAMFKRFLHWLYRPLPNYFTLNKKVKFFLERERHPQGYKNMREKKVVIVCCKRV